MSINFSLRSLYRFPCGLRSNLLGKCGFPSQKNPFDQVSFTIMCGGESMLSYRDEFLMEASPFYKEMLTIACGGAHFNRLTRNSLLWMSPFSTSTSLNVSFGGGQVHFIKVRGALLCGGVHSK